MLKIEVNSDGNLVGIYSVRISYFQPNFRRTKFRLGYIRRNYQRKLLSEIASFVVVNLVYGLKFYMVMILVYGLVLYVCTDRFTLLLI